MRTVFELALKRILRQRLTIVLMLVFPVFIAFLPQPEGMEIPIIGYGLFGLVILFSAFLLTKQLIEDRQNKTIVRIAASPITHRTYLIGHLGAYMCVMMIQIIIFFGLSLLSWQAGVVFYVYAFPLIIVFTIMAICFSLFWHSMFKAYATSVALFSVVANLMAVIGGMSFPLQFLPDSIRRFSIVFPTYWYAYGLELIGEERYGLVYVCLLILLGFAIIFLTIGSKRRFA